MQPPNETTSAPAPRQPAPRGDEDQLYRQHHRNLNRAVARVVHAPRELIEDACQTAWTTLLRTQPERRAIFAWLRIVAIYEAYRLCASERRHLHLDAMAPAGSSEAAIGRTHSIDDTLAAHDALQILASLPERQRTDLTLLVAGYSYAEIAKITGGRTYTNVNKSLVKARGRIRRAHSRWLNAQ